MQVQKIDHICFAVADLERTKRIYSENLSMKPDLEYVADSEHIKVARYYVGGVAIEFMEPTSRDCDVARFIEQRGDGAFLISYRVDNLDTALEELKAKGAKLIDEKPRELFGNRYAFIQKPSEMAGVLVELLDGEFDPSQVKRT